MATGQQEPGQQGPHSCASDRDFTLAVVDHQWTQDAQLHLNDRTPVHRSATRRVTSTAPAAAS